MSIIDLLKEDHREAMDMIERLAGAGRGTPTGTSGAEGDQTLFNELKNALKMHTKVEEQIFYPALEKNKETRDLIKESYREHKKVDQLLAKIEKMTPGRDWKKLLRDLRDNVQHHVNREEKKLLPKAEKILGKDRLQEMGREMEEMKRGVPV